LITKRRIVFAVAATAFVSAALIAVAVANRSTGEFTLDNRSSEMIDHAVVEVCGQKFDFTELPSGTVRGMKFKIGADSDYGVSVKFHSGRRLSAHVGYVTSGVKYHDKLIVANNAIILNGGNAEIK
jgi:hypothetical protein